MSDSGSNESIFLTLRTYWTIIETARDPAGEPAAARRALETLLKRYRPVILSSIRGSGIDPASCEDVCQEFLVENFLAKTLPRAERSRGRFRTFLSLTLRLFLIDHRRSTNAAKTGARVTASIEELPEGTEIQDPSEASPPPLDFEIAFASCMHQDVLSHLRADYDRARQLPVFESLIPWLLEKEAGLDVRLGDALGMSPVAVRQALSRLRVRYRNAFITRVREIVDEDEDPQEEMKHLLKILLSGTRSLKK
jgi:DNA-directed RNA polymerase specialized sigma24 family protein